MSETKDNYFKKKKKSKGFVLFVTYMNLAKTLEIT